MHDVEIEIVDSPICELFTADRLDFITIVEGVPELGDEKEVGAFAEAVFDCAGDAFTSFFFVAVVWGESLGYLPI